MNLSLCLQYAVVVADGLRRSLNIQSPLEKPLEMLCVCVSSITVNSSLNLPVLLLLLLFVCEFDHCKIFPSVSRKSYH